MLSARLILSNMRAMRADGWTGQLIEQNEALKSNEKQKQIHTQRLQANLSLQKKVNAEENFYNQQLEKNVNLQKQYNKTVKKNLLNNSATTETPVTPSSGHTMTEKERKAARRRKRSVRLRLARQRQSARPT